MSSKQQISNIHAPILQDNYSHYDQATANDLRELQRQEQNYPTYGNFDNN